MAQLKQLSAGSSQIIMMMFRDKNNAPIKADSVHVKGSIFTGSGKPFEFEVNKGVCTNCKIQNDMLLFNIVPLLGFGQMQVYTQTYLGDTKAITGTYISENQQKLGVEVVQKGTFLSDRQGAMCVDSVSRQRLWSRKGVVGIYGIYRVSSKDEQQVLRI